MMLLTTNARITSSAVKKFELFFAIGLSNRLFPLLPSLLLLSLLCSVQHLSITSLFLASLPFHEGALEGLTSPDTIISRREKKCFSPLSFAFEESMFPTFRTRIHKYSHVNKTKAGLRESVFSRDQS